MDKLREEIAEIITEALLQAECVVTDPKEEMQFENVYNYVNKILNISELKEALKNKEFYENVAMNIKKSLPDTSRLERFRKCPECKGNFILGYHDTIRKSFPRTCLHCKDGIQTANIQPNEIEVFMDNHATIWCNKDFGAFDLIESLKGKGWDIRLRGKG